MQRHLKKLLVAAAVTAALMVSASTAQATIMAITVTDSNLGALTGSATIDTATALQGSWSNAYYTVVLNTGISNTPGSPGTATLSLTSNVSTGSGTVTGAGGTLDIVITAFDYTAPGGAINDSENASAAVSGNPVASTDSVSWQSWVNGSNTSSKSGLTPGTITGTPSGLMSFVLSPNPSSKFGTTATPYSLVGELKIKLGSNEGPDTFGGVQTVTPTAVPAPPSIILALTGLPFLGVGGWLRRRLTRA
jgi:hypothetical protein